MKNVNDLHAVMDRVIDGLEGGTLPVNEANSRTKAVTIKTHLIDLQFKAIKVASALGHKVDLKKPIDLMLAESTGIKRLKNN